MPIDVLEEIFHPQSVAVAGSSNNPDSSGYAFTRFLVDYGFKGKIYTVNPRYPEILGMKAYPSIRDIPGTVDYVICALAASEVLRMLDDCAEKGVKCVHFFTGRFSETGRRESAELEQEVLRRARKYGIRLIGPNCMGIYYPREGLAFGYDYPLESGPVGVATQSGGGAQQLVYLASMRGVRFSKVVSYGNALDFNECDYLEYFAQDPETEIILLYIEGVKDGRRFFDLLRQTTPKKPVVVVKGGRGKAGVRSVASHTASLAGSMRAWEAAITQAGAVSAKNFDEMSDLAVSFSFLPPIKGYRVGVAGGGGGASVLGGDECEEEGLDVIPLPDEIRQELKSKDVPIWDWIGNPMDQSVSGGFGFTALDMMQIMTKHQNFDFLIGNMTEGGPRRKELVMTSRRNDTQNYIRLKKENKKPFLVVVEEKSLTMSTHNHWRWKELSGVRTKLIAAKIPIYPSIGRAARAARKLIDYYVWRNSSL